MSLLRNLRLHLLTTALVGTVATLQTPGASAATLSADLAQILSLKPARVNVIVQSNGPVSSVLLLTIQLLGGRVYAQFTSINAVAVDAPVNLITSLLTNLGVERMCP